MLPLKCFVADSMHESLFRLLKEAGWMCDYEPSASREEIRKRLKGYDGLIIRTKTTVDRDLIGDDPTLLFVGRAGAGLDNVDVNYLREKNIQVIHAAEGNRDAVGEFTIGILLSLMRNIPRAHEEVTDFKWERERNRGEELMGKTVGLVGYGNMGRAFAQRLSGFRCKVLAFDKYKSGYSDDFCREATMEEIFSQTDVLSLHIPLTGETRGMVNSQYFGRFAKRIIVVNTARGEIIPLHDLAEAVKNGKVRGAALDVLENEKIDQLNAQQLQSFKYLSGKTNVIFTPHIAGWTFESHEKINVALVDKLKSFSFRQRK